MKTVFVISKYPPDITATGNLLMKLVDVYSESNKTTILTSSNIFYDKYEIITYNKKERIINSIRILKNRLIFQKDLYNKLENVVKSYNEKVLLIPLTIEEIHVSLEIKREYPKKVILAPFLVEILPENYQKKTINSIKKRIEEIADFVIILPKLKNYFSNINELIVEHPMVIDSVLNTFSNSIVYVGGFNRRGRNILPIINYLIKSSEKKMKIEIYGYGNQVIDLKKLSEKNLITFGGPVNNYDATRILSNANFIVTIGNKDSKLVPSKLFDCISTGKPIIHFFQNSDDPYIDYLKNYEASICINYDAVEVEEIKKFISENNYKTVPFSQIEKNFKIFTPKYVTEQINSEVDKYF